MAIKPLKMRLIANTRKFGIAMQKATHSVRDFATKSKKKLGGLKNKMTGMSGAMKAGIAVVGVAGIVSAAKEVVKFDEKLARLRIAANLTAKETEILKNRFLELSKTTSQSAINMLTGYDAIIQRTGDVELANKTLERMGIVATASGSSMEKIGTTFTNLKEKIGLTIPEIERAMNIFTEQGKMAAFSLAKMAKELPQILSTAGVFGVQGEKGIRTLGTLMQLGMRAYGGLAEQARTGIQGVLRDIPTKGDQIAKVFKFSIFTKKDGVQTLKSLDEILRGILAASKGNALLLGKVFSGVALDTLAPLLKSYQEFGFKEYDKFMNVVSGDEALMKDFAIAAATTAAQLGSVKSQFFELSTKTFDRPIIEFTKAMTELNEMQLFANLGELTGRLVELGAIDIAAPFRALNEVIEPIAANIEAIVNVLQFTGKAAKVPFEILSTIIRHTPPALALKYAIGDDREQRSAKIAKARVRQRRWGIRGEIPILRQFGEDRNKRFSGMIDKSNTTQINNAYTKQLREQQTIVNMTINIKDGAANVITDARSRVFATVNQNPSPSFEIGE